MPFTGQAANPEGAVGAGLDSILIQDGRVIAFASGMNFDVDYEIEGVRTLGFHGDRFFKSMGYTASMTIESYVLRTPNEPGALATPGWQSDGKFNLNTAGEFDFVVADVNDLTILFTMLQCKLSTEAVQFPARGLNTKSTSWRCSRIDKKVPVYSNVNSKFREFREPPNVKAEGNPEPSLNFKEGATTIPFGSTLQVNNGSGSAKHPVKDDDIVSSSMKILAVHSERKSPDEAF